MPSPVQTMINLFISGLRLDALNHPRASAPRSVEETRGKLTLGPKGLEWRMCQSSRKALRTPASGGGGRAQRQDKEGAEMERRCRRKGHICKSARGFMHKTGLIAIQSRRFYA